MEVPGTAALNTGKAAGTDSVSCASAGNCGAGGFYTDSAGNQQAFVASQVKGTWGKAVEVPGTAALNASGYATITSLSCASAGNCGAGGYYTDSAGHRQAFVVSQVNGTWGKAVEVPGTAALNTGGTAEADSLSCASAGNCSTGGFYTDSSGHQQAYVASQVNGTWDDAVEVPGTAALNAVGYAQVNSVSCASAGNCSAGGYYTDSSSSTEAFVASEVNGTWLNAIEVPKTPALNTGGNARVNSVSCASAGNCGASGIYLDSTGSPTFVVSQVNGTWGKAAKVPGTAALNSIGGSLSCASAGNCSAGGSYDNAHGVQAFVVSQVNGTWGKAVEVPGTATLNVDGEATVTSLSCASAGNCSAGGWYRDSTNSERAFVVSQVNGTWGNAVEVPGTSTGSATTDSVSCASAGNCSAGGLIYTAAHGVQAFVVSEMASP